mmetsp:Transcript_37292/g.78050  ORF Transcript_37292/g.78050 Transcript_37292/m.78050 type:complete len:236 (-) Transcript_37292:237-944(-)
MLLPHAPQVSAGRAAPEVGAQLDGATTDRGDPRVLWGEDRALLRLPRLLHQDALVARRLRPRRHPLPAHLPPPDGQRRQPLGAPLLRLHLRLEHRDVLRVEAPRAAVPVRVGHPRRGGHGGGPPGLHPQRQHPHPPHRAQGHLRTLPRARLAHHRLRHRRRRRLREHPRRRRRRRRDRVRALPPPPPPRAPPHGVARQARGRPRAGALHHAAQLPLRLRPPPARGYAELEDGHGV